MNGGNIMKDYITKVLNDQIQNLEHLKETSFAADLQQAIEVCIDSLKNGNKILLAGNGGSAADSQHFAAELVGRFLKERRALPAIALTTDSSNMTSIANDYSYDVIFSRQLEALGKNGDVFIGISTSGNSNNIIEAVKEAKKQNVITLGILGRDGGKLKEMCDYTIVVDFDYTPHIQEVHEMIVHMMCEQIENALCV